MTHSSSCTSFDSNPDRSFVIRLTMPDRFMMHCKAIISFSPLQLINVAIITQLIDNVSKSGRLERGFEHKRKWTFGVIAMCANKEKAHLWHDRDEVEGGEIPIITLFYTITKKLIVYSTSSVLMRSSSNPLIARRFRKHYICLSPS